MGWGCVWWRRRRSARNELAWLMEGLVSEEKEYELNLLWDRKSRKPAEVFLDRSHVVVCVEVSE